ncbi:DUF3298 and DUF4163 domain-containing protein [Desulfogranum marinum]|uniref:DUF3298 and DUF4163 domain-containing protein n=1 Tax=Desulfogranum marinum TaxID=453220 RepID=UPI001963130E|nr:DUF3298 and DUF4163 domain-containing protein [Desulfogranum marinum]MBM9515222.1 DUF3298 domain-containing protein [Desulfogranum marinum]
MEKVTIANLSTKASFAALMIFSILSFSGNLHAEEEQRYAKRTIKKEYSGVEIDINYPFMTDKTPSAAVFNKLVKDITVKIWPQYYQSSLPESQRKPLWEMELCGDDEEKCNKTYSLDYEVYYAEDNYVSIRFKQYWYQGGLHGSYASFGLNYNIQDSEEMKLDDLFQSDSSYQDKLVELSDQGLKDVDCAYEEADREYDFENWMVNQEGLEIIFPIYSVAPYSCGQQSVSISFSSLQDILSDTFVSLLKHKKVN